MRSVKYGSRQRQILTSLVGLLALALMVPSLAAAENASRGAQQEGDRHAQVSAHADQPLADQIRQLREKVADLEVALKQKHQGKRPEEPGGMGMKRDKMPMRPGGKNSSKQGIGMKGLGMMGMGAMSKKDGMAGQGMSKKRPMTGTEMMGRMKTMGGAKPAKPLPAFPGAPGIYHVGATGFFLDQVDAISLTPEQQAALKQIRNEAMAEQAALDAQIEKAEEQLGQLTGSDQPDATRIEASVREIERLRANQRMAFIQAVGRAGNILTDQQRKAL